MKRKKKIKDQDLDNDARPASRPTFAARCEFGVSESRVGEMLSSVRMLLLNGCCHWMEIIILRNA